MFLDFYRKILLFHTISIYIAYLRFLMCGIYEKML